MPIALVVFMCVVLAFAVYLLIRNQQVYNYRTRMSKIVFDASVWDYKWRLAVMERVSYDDMIRRFWKPLDSFYPDKSFLDLNDVRGFAPWQQEKTLQAREFIQ